MRGPLDSQLLPASDAPQAEGESSPLPLGQWVSGSLANTGASVSYQVSVEAGQRLMVQLDGSYSVDDNELYVRYGALPTTTQYDAAGKVANLSDQYLEVPLTQAGTYYILVRCTEDWGGDDGSLPPTQTRRSRP